MKRLRLIYLILLLAGVAGLVRITNHEPLITIAKELFSNNAKSTLASGITNSQTTLTVQSGHGARFPSPTGSDYFYATLDDGANIEIVKCTARSTDTFTITRAQQGTTGIAFSTGAKVELRITKGALEDVQLTTQEVDGSPLVSATKIIRFGNGTVTDDGNGQVTVASSGSPIDADYWVETANGTLTAETVVGTTGISTAAYSSRQSAAKAGRLFFPSDSFYIERDTGSAWASWGPLYPFTAPVDGDFSWVNQGGASVSTTHGGINMSVPADASRNFRIRKKTAPSPPYKVTAWFSVAIFPGTTNATLVFGFRQSSDGKLACIGVLQSSMVSQKNTSATVFSANYINPSYNSEYTLRQMCIRIADDNTNRVISLSNNGQDFLAFHSVGRTDFLTADAVFWGGDAESSSAGMEVTLMSWKEESFLLLFFPFLPLRARRHHDARRKAA